MMKFIPLLTQNLENRMKEIGVLRVGKYYIRTSLGALFNSNEIQKIQQLDEMMEVLKSNKEDDLKKLSLLIGYLLKADSNLPIIKTIFETLALDFLIKIPSLPEYQKEVLLAKLLLMIKETESMPTIRKILELYSKLDLSSEDWIFILPLGITAHQEAINCYEFLNTEKLLTKYNIQLIKALISIRPKIVFSTQLVQGERPRNFGWFMACQELLKRLKDENLVTQHSFELLTATLKQRIESPNHQRVEGSNLWYTQNYTTNIYIDCLKRLKSKDLLKIYNPLNLLYIPFFSGVSGLNDELFNQEILNLFLHMKFEPEERGAAETLNTLWKFNKSIFKTDKFLENYFQCSSEVRGCLSKIFHLYKRLNFNFDTTRILKFSTADVETLKGIANGLFFIRRHGENWTKEIKENIFESFVYKHPIFFSINNEFFLRTIDRLPEHLDMRMTLDQINEWIRQCDLIMDGDYNRVLNGVEQFINRILIENGVDNNQRQNRVRINYGQSVHNQQVHKTVTESVIRLLNRYDKSDLKKEAGKLCEWIGTLIENDIKTRSAQQALTRFTTKDSDYIEPMSKISILQVLGLFWVAIHDEEKCIGSLASAKKMLVQALYETQREYNFNEMSEDKDESAVARPACLPGSFNKIVEKLVGIHPDVQISFVTKELAVLKLMSLIREEIKEYFIEPPLKKALEKKSKFSWVLNFIEALNEVGVSLVWNDDIKNSIADKMFEEFGCLWKSKDDPSFMELIDQSEYINLNIDLSKNFNIQRRLGESSLYQDYCSQIMWRNYSFWKQEEKLETKPPKQDQVFLIEDKKLVK